jgi:hypothetical protein
MDAPGAVPKSETRIDEGGLPRETSLKEDVVKDVQDLAAGIKHEAKRFAHGCGFIAVMLSIAGVTSVLAAAAIVYGLIKSSDPIIGIGIGLGAVAVSIAVILLAKTTSIVGGESSIAADIVALGPGPVSTAVIALCIFVAALAVSVGVAVPLLGTIVGVVAAALPPGALATLALVQLVRRAKLS